MTLPAPRNAALDNILRRTKHLILDFDGPVCSLYPHPPAVQAADQLRAVLIRHNAEIPQTIATTGDALAVLTYATTLSAEIGRQAEAELTQHEISAVAMAQATSYIHEVVSSASEGHRTSTVISTCSMDAILAYLDRASLTRLFGLIIGRTYSASGVIAESDLIDRALSELGAEPTACVLVTASGSLLDITSNYGLASILYARTLTIRDSPLFQAETTIASLAEIVLGLRAHPLPS